MARSSIPGTAAARYTRRGRVFDELQLLRALPREFDGVDEHTRELRVLQQAVREHPFGNWWL
jgi:hypothetical protein